MPKKLTDYIKSFLLMLGLAAAYYFSAKLGLKFAFVNASTTALWPPTGITLAAFLIFGFRIWPAIFLGAFLANLTTAGTIVTSLGIAVGNTLEGVVGAYLVNKYANGRYAFDEMLDIFKFTLLAAFLSTAVSAIIGVATLALGGFVNWNEFGSVWLTWWLGDMGGDLVIAPLILVWWNNPRVSWDYLKLLNLGLSFLTFFAIIGIVFSGILPYAYLCLPIAVWVAFWFGQKGATVSTILVAVVAILFTLAHLGPFANAPDLNHSLILVQLFLGIFSLTGVIFAGAILKIKKGESALSSHEERFKALIENSFDAVVLIDPAAKILYASPSVKRILGYSPEEIEGTNGFELVFPEDRGSTMKELAKLLLKPGGSISIEYRTIRKDQQVIWVEVTGTNLLLEPNVGAVVVNFRDVTKEKQIDQAKTEFVSLASHQLRTPLTTVKWYAEMLLGNQIGSLTPKQKEYLNEVYGSNQRMINLVNDLLDVSRIDMGTFFAESEQIDLKELVENILKDYKPQISSKKLEINKTFDGSSKIKIDSRMCRIILQNLLSNAIKYTLAGGKIDLKLNTSSNNLSIKITDNGMGIPADAQGKIFTKFFRAANVKEVDTRGTGLGLYLVKSLVEKAGGKLEFRSKENQGTTFEITVPLK